MPRPVSPAAHVEWRNFHQSLKERVLYPKEYFLERFRNDETEELLQRYATADLADEAKEAIASLLRSRGVDHSALQPLVLQARKAAYRQTKGTYECDFCSNSARFASLLDEGQRFCSKACLRNARLMEVSEDISKEAIHSHAFCIKNGTCPECQQSGSKTEARRSYRVWSLGIFSQATTRTHICCHSCGRKKNFGAIVFSTVLGWWGIPWGVIMTPAQIVANITEMFKPMDDPTPSDALLQAARLDLAVKLYKKRAVQEHAQSLQGPPR